MSSQHKAPLAAFLVVCVACVVVVVSALHSEALSTYLKSRVQAAQSIVAGTSISPQQHEAARSPKREAASHEAAGLVGRPDTAEAIGTEATHAGPAAKGKGKRHETRHAAIDSGTLTSAGQTAVTTSSVSVEQAPAAPEQPQGSGPRSHGTPGTGHTAPIALPSYGQKGHHDVAAPSQSAPDRDGDDDSGRTSGRPGSHGHSWSWYGNGSTRQNTHPQSLRNDWGNDWGDGHSYWSDNSRSGNGWSSRDWFDRGRRGRH